jgi:hypothetical protein
MNRHALLLGLAFTSLAGVAQAQSRPSRDDLLDTLTRHIQICAEIAGSQDRLACFDRLQTQVGNAQSAAPQPIPLQRDIQAAQPAAVAPPQPLEPLPTSQQLTPQPLTPPPLMPQPLGLPGGGVATLGGPTPLPPPSGSNPDAAYNPNQSSYQPPATQMPKPVPPVRRTGPRPVPVYSTPQPLVSLSAQNLTFNPAGYWQVTIVVTSNTPRTLDLQIQCNFTNAGRYVADAFFGPTPIQAGEQITTELIGPPTSAYVDSTTCRVVAP